MPVTVSNEIIAALPAPGSTVIVDGAPVKVVARGCVYTGIRAPFTPEPALRLAGGRAIIGTAALYIEVV